MRFAVPVVTGLLFAVCRAIAQQSPSLQPVKFEVASVKPNKSAERMYFGLRGDKLTIRNMSLKGMIQIAYGKRDFQVTGGPGWVNGLTFDMDAKAERPAIATHDMLKSLLAERFNLKVHSETKQATIYSLVLARGGVKMNLSADQSEPEKGGPKELAPGRMAGEGIPMYIIANLLSNALGRPVINNTGRTGKYDVDLRYVPEAPAPSGVADDLSRADVLDIAIISAVEKQLGLKLEATKGPMEILVIEQAEKPAEN